MARPGRIVGRCAVCRLPVVTQASVRIEDRSVTDHEGRPIRRLAHAGDCAAELRHRVGAK